jgi:hypothetical protein
MPPSFSHVESQLSGVLSLVREAIDEGAAHVRQYAAEHDGGVIDPSLAPCLVRHRAKKLLSLNGQTVTDEELLIEEAAADEPRFVQQYLPNNGLCMNVGGFQLRILKADANGAVPLAGRSENRQLFYNQQLSLFDHEPERETDGHPSKRWGVVVYWIVDTGFELAAMGMAFPKNAESKRASFKTHWDEIIWRRPQAEQPIPEAEVEDLDIGRLERAGKARHAEAE